MQAGRRAQHCAALATLLLMGAGLSACSGWSSWEQGRHSTTSAPRSAPAARGSAETAAGEYRVAAGDTLYSIAFRNNLDYRELARWNGIGGDYRIYVGQRLRLQPGAAQSKHAAPLASVPARPPVVLPGAAAQDKAATPGTSVTVTTPADSGLVGAPLAGAVAGMAAGAGAAVDGAAASVAPSASATTAPSAGPVLRPAPEPESMPELGSYAWTWPTLGAVTRGFGQDGSKGVDLGGQLGQPVFAAAPGRVVYSGNALKGYGELIIIKHDETFLSAYGYNRLRHVKEGDIVTTGQPIGELGLGPENQPMLHFEIRNKGQPIDPLGKLPRR